MTAAIPVDRYPFGSSPEMQALFNHRQAHVELEVLLPHLQPGMRVIDLGCGAGSMTCDVAALVAPGPVVGLDLSESAIRGARDLAETRGLTNVAFEVGNVYETTCPSDGFDVVMISVVLSHLAEPLRAAVEAHRLLAPGGVIVAREMMKDGDWFAGPYADRVAQLNRAFIASHRARGADPTLGKRLKSILVEAGFTGVQGRPTYSQALSSPARIVAVLHTVLDNPGITQALAADGIATEAERAELSRSVETWAADDTSIAAMAEYIAWGAR